MVSDSEEPDKPDVEIAGKATIREITFIERSPTTTRFSGRPGYRAKWRSYRKGLPETVVRGKPYRGVEVVSRWAADVDPEGQRKEEELHQHEEVPGGH